MIVVHHLNNSRSQRVLWLLEELGVEYEIKRYQRDAVTSLAPQALKDIHPLGKSPVLTDGDITVAESGAIIEYLLDSYGPQFIPEKGSEAQRQHTYWMHFAEGTFMPPMIVKLIFDKVRSSVKPFFIRSIANKIADQVMGGYFGPNLLDSLKFIEDHLSQNSWFAGESMSGADYQMIFPLEAIKAAGGAKPYPHIEAYVEKVHQLDSYKRAVEKGGQYDYA